MDKVSPEQSLIVQLVTSEDLSDPDVFLSFDNQRPESPGSADFMCAQEGAAFVERNHTCVGRIAFGQKSTAKHAGEMQKVSPDPRVGADSAVQDRHFVDAVEICLLRQERVALVHERVRAHKPALELHFSSQSLTGRTME